MSMAFLWKIWLVWAVSLNLAIAVGFWVIREPLLGWMVLLPALVKPSTKATLEAHRQLIDKEVSHVE